MEPYSEKRLELMSLIPALRETTCRLHIIDIPVRLEERIDAWREAGGNPQNIDEFRADCALTVRSKSVTAPEKVTTLDLENANLRHIDLSAYVNLKHLRYASHGTQSCVLHTCRAHCCVLCSLRGNFISAESFRSGEALGLPGLISLETIDLRENELMLSNPDNLTAVLGVLNTLPKLRSIGLCGNWDAEDRAL